MSFDRTSKELASEIVEARTPLKKLGDAFSELMDLILSDKLFDNNGKEFYEKMVKFSKYTPEPITLARMSASMMLPGIMQVAGTAFPENGAQTTVPPFMPSPSLLPGLQRTLRREEKGATPGYPAAILGAISIFALVYLFVDRLITISVLGLAFGAVLMFEFLPSILSRLPRIADKEAEEPKGEASIEDLFEQAFALFKDNMYLKMYVKSRADQPFEKDLNAQALFELRARLTNIIRKIKQIAEAEWNAQKSAILDRAVALERTESMRPIDRPTNSG